MLIEEIIEDGKFVKHYSDSRMLIKQLETDMLYGEAIDLIPCKYTYEETDIPIEEPEESEEEEEEPDERIREEDSRA